MMGDYSFLEEKLAYLRSFDALHSNVDTQTTTTTTTTTNRSRV